MDGAPNKYGDDDFGGSVWRMTSLSTSGCW